MKGLACFGLLVFAILSIVLGSVLCGWVLSIMWGWFVVPLFAVPPLSIPAAIGFSLVMSLLTHQSIPSRKDKTTTESVSELLGAFLAPLLVLLAGYIVHLFL